MKRLSNTCFRSRTSFYCDPLSFANLRCLSDRACLHQMLHDVRHYGYEVKDYSFDWRTIKEARDAYIKRLNGIYLTNLEKAGVALITGYAAFVGLNTIQVYAVIYHL
jgi:pyruvate/2-oxoglutarate dehydrogenase complex dihydrolipoamide dehydrogenase (E3) component